MGKLVKISVAMATMACIFAFVGCSNTGDESTNSENITQNPENPRPNEPNQDEHTHTWGETYADNDDGTHYRTCAECGDRSEPEAHEYSGETYTDEGHYKTCTLCGADSAVRPHTWIGTYTDNGDGTHSRTCAECGVYSKEEHKYVGSTCEICGSRRELPGMVYVEGGTFQMGCDDDDASNSEKPVHVVIVSSFFIGKYEVTHAEYEPIIGNNPSYFTGNDNRPVECVTWYNAVEYCNKRSEKEGLTPCYTIDGTNVTCNWDANGYRLPTEAEWEYAARGGKNNNSYTYSGSDNISEVAWYWENSGKDLDSNDPNYGTHGVGEKKANELGIYDMSGNVWEWCWDRFGSEYYSSSPTINPHGPASGSNRVMRGGSWHGSVGYCRCTDRFSFDPGAMYDNFGYCVGFRVVRALH